MTIKSDPGVYRRHMRVELREARKAVKMTQQEAASRLEWSLSKLIRIEAGAVGVSITDMRALLALYNVLDPERQESLLEAARKSRGKPWWQEFHELIRPPFAQLLAFENSSSLVRAYSPVVIPALLQTTAYADALREHTVPDAARRAQMIELLQKRQELFDSPDMPEVAFVIDESALRRWAGGPTVMHDQLVHLKEMMGRPRVSVRILPFTAGAHGALGGSFILLESKDGDDDVVFFEGAQGDTITREDHELHAHYVELFESLSAQALRNGEDVALLDKLIAEYAAA